MNNYLRQRKFLDWFNFRYSNYSRNPFTSPDTSYDKMKLLFNIQQWRRHKIRLSVTKMSQFATCLRVLTRQNINVTAADQHRDVSVADAFQKRA